MIFWSLAGNLATHWRMAVRRRSKQVAVGQVGFGELLEGHLAEDLPPTLLPPGDSRSPCDRTLRTPAKEILRQLIVGELFPDRHERLLQHFLGVVPMGYQRANIVRDAPCFQQQASELLVSPVESRLE